MGFQHCGIPVIRVPHAFSLNIEECPLEAPGLGKLMGSLLKRWGSDLTWTILSPIFSGGHNGYHSDPSDFLPGDCDNVVTAPVLGEPVECGLNCLAPCFLFSSPHKIQEIFHIYLLKHLASSFFLETQARRLYFLGCCVR